MKFLLIYVPNLRFPQFIEPWNNYIVSELLTTFPTNSLSWDQLVENPDSSLKNLHYGLIHNGFETTCITSENQLFPYIKHSFIPTKYALIQNGDLILADASEDRKDVGKPVEMLDIGNQKIVSGLHTIHARNKTDLIVNGFKGFYFQSSAMKQQIFKIANGSKIYGISSSAFNELKMFIPEKQEQKKIIDLMIKIEERIQTQSKIISDYNSLKRGITQCIFNTSQQYSSVHLKVILKEISRKNKNRDNNNILSVSNSLGFIKQSEQFEDREIASSDTSNYKIVNKNEYAYNPARINVGSIARLQNFDCGIVSPMYTIFTIDISKITYEYFDLFLQSSTFQKQLSQKLEGSVRQCLTFASMQNILIKLPPLETQIEISGKMKFIDSKIKLESDYLNLLQSEKNYLLKNLFI